ncbi:MAG: hypothetical protein Q8R55_04065, partial [Candidatus Taylorbacteria bacterium]|nr:hypothetical protein [Candidatus Taylorbacteria bacterium]
MKKTVAFIGIVVVILVVGYIFLFGRGETVVITDRAPWFIPALLEIDPGTTVIWKLKAAAVHPVMTLDAPQEFNSGHFTDTWSYTFDTPGLYTYICPIHPYMKGLVGVGVPVPPEKIPAWVTQWPPKAVEVPAGLPATPGVGEVWIATQFADVAGKEKPGTITVVNAATWKVARTIDDARLNNPHNLWEVNGKVLATNWFDKFVIVIDKKTGMLEQHVWVGESPAHIHAHDGKRIYVTLQGDDGITVLDDRFERVETFRTSDGPHGHWFSADGTRMVLASTEAGSISVWDTTTNTKLFEETVGDDLIEHRGMESSS